MHSYDWGVMSRKLEIALVVVVLVVAPMVVGVIAASSRSPRYAPTAYASFAPLVEQLGYTASRCEWTQGHGNASCSLQGGGSCSFATSSHTGSCTTKGGSDSYLVWAESP
jgi:hypothetical protein